MDIFTMADNLLTKVVAFGGLALVCLCGYLMLGHLSRHKVAAVVVVFLVALFPAMFLLDPTGAATLLTNTVTSIIKGA